MLEYFFYKLAFTKRIVLMSVGVCVHIFVSPRLSKSFKSEASKDAENFPRMADIINTIKWPLLPTSRVICLLLKKMDLL